MGAQSPPPPGLSPTPPTPDSDNLLHLDSAAFHTVVSLGFS